MGDWLEIRDTSGRIQYLNMRMVAGITIGNSTPGLADGERARIVFIGGEWASTANKEDIAKLIEWVRNDHP